MADPAPHPFASRTDVLEPFLAMEVMERAFAMEHAGISVSHLEVGEPDFAAPEAAVSACAQALRDGETHYSDSRGLIELRTAIANDVETRFQVSVDPDRVMVTSGTSPAMLLVFSLLIEQGDEIVLGAPCYPCYPNFIRYCGGVPVFVETVAEDAYLLDPEAVRRAITPRTRAILIGSPANPTGAIQPREVVEALSELGLPLISDEIYDGLVYGDAAVTSALAARANLPDAALLGVIASSITVQQIGTTGTATPDQIVNRFSDEYPDGFEPSDIALQPRTGPHDS